jgi:hypothetical protein
MKPLGYREIFWDVSADPSGEGLLIAAYDDERELFDAGRDAEPATGRPLDLSGLVSDADPTTSIWTRRRMSADAARSLGTQLWAALPREIREPLRALAGPARLKVSTATPAAGDLPWEWLTDGSAQPPLALRPDFVLARSVPLRFPLHPLSVQLPLRVLLLMPNPKDERLLDGDTEIQTALAALPAPAFSVRVLDVPVLEALTEALVEEQPNIVHYIGHGGLTHGEGNLILQDAGGKSRWVDATELAALLPSSVRLLCLATPVTAENYQVLGLSHLARGARLSGLPTTVANQYPVDGAAAAEFWKAFYAALLVRGNVNHAVQEARLRAAAVDTAHADWGSFSLVIRDQTGVSFELRGREEAAVRRPAELRAQFAAEAANELAQQVQILGDETPAGLVQRYEVEQRRVTELLDELTEA